MKKYITPILSLLLITIFVVGLLALTNQLTQDAIKQRELTESEKAMNLVLPDGAPFLDITQEVMGLDLKISSKLLNAYKSDKGYVFTMITKGYNGDIEVFVGINNNEEVQNIALGKNEETPNLGKNAELPEFTSQFSGITKRDVVSKKIDNISNATVTTQAVISAVESALALHAEVVK